MRVLLTLMLIPGFADNSFAKTGNAEIVSVIGNVHYSESADWAWNAANVGQLLYSGNFVKTGDLSKAGILLIDQTQIRINENSLFQVKIIAGQQDGDIRQIKQKSWSKNTGDKNGVLLKKGSAWMKSKNVPEDLLIQTPAASASIHGTDWLLEVDEDGRTRLTVLSGEVTLFNEHGAVTVGKNEQAEVMPGQGPVKSTVHFSRQRVQWVSSYLVQPRQYAEFKPSNIDRYRALPAILDLVDAGRLNEAREALTAVSPETGTPAACRLLLADIAVYAGDLRLAEKEAAAGWRDFPDDQRFPAQLARIALYQDDFARARQLVEEALAKAPGAVELLLVKGELERLDGNAGAALDAYAQATALADAGDGRGWRGLGVVEGERDNYRPARTALDEALAREPGLADARGELATIEAQADRLPVARDHYRQAIAQRSDDYIALTGMGLLELKAGQPEAALTYLLKATTLEPEYNRAVIYTAVAYYQLGRIEDALDTLRAAAEIDDKDPLPHLYLSMIYQDLVEPAPAVSSSRQAFARMPNLKSLNQVVNDRQGKANIGSALSLFGLENWAIHYAQESYLPNWASSHLFLADHYQGTFKKNSELMQGFLTDPVLFGASPAWSSLVPAAGSHAVASFRANTSDEIRVYEPALSLNGYANAALPFAWFGEGILTVVESRDLPLDGDAFTGTLGLGVKPAPDLGIFAYLNNFHADVDSPQDGIKDNLNGDNRRFDVGASLRFSSTSQSWLKFGRGLFDGNREIDHTEFIANGVCSGDAAFKGNCDFNMQFDDYDIQYRHTLTLDGGHELAVGWEGAKTDLSLDTILSGNTLEVPGLKISLSDDEADRSQVAFASGRFRVSHELLVQADLNYSQYRKKMRATGFIEQGGDHLDLGENRYSFDDKGLYPSLGLEYRFPKGLTLRAAWQDWLRPTSYLSLAPLATAGIPLADELVLPGGELKRARMQIDWEVGESVYLTMFYDRSKTDNLSLGVGSVLNERRDMAELERMRPRDFANLPTLEQLEDLSIFSKGRVDSAGISAEAVVTSRLSVNAGYIYSDGRNTSDGFDGFDLPYVPQHRAALGATWFPLERCRLQVQGIYRSSRYVNEPNTQSIDADVRVTVKGEWESAEKRWKVEAYAADLFADGGGEFCGVNVVWRMTE